GGSNPPLSANQSVHFAYILEKAKTPREMWRSFSPQRTGEPLTPDSPDSASILSVRNRNGSLQHLHRAERRTALISDPLPLLHIVSVRQNKSGDNFRC